MFSAAHLPHCTRPLGTLRLREPTPRFCARSTAATTDTTDRLPGLRASSSALQPPTSAQHIFRTRHFIWSRQLSYRCEDSPAHDIRGVRLTAKASHAASHNGRSLSLQPLALECRVFRPSCNPLPRGCICTAGRAHSSPQSHSLAVHSRLPGRHAGSAGNGLGETGSGHWCSMFHER